MYHTTCYESCHSFSDWGITWFPHFSRLDVLQSKFFHLRTTNNGVNWEFACFCQTSSSTTTCGWLKASKTHTAVYFVHPIMRIKQKPIVCMCDLWQTEKFNVHVDWFQDEVQLKTVSVEAQLDSSFEEVTEEAPLAEVIEPSSDHANVSITEQQLKTDNLAEKRHKKTK